MDILQKLRQGFVVFDGGMGTMLLQKGLQAGESPESWNTKHPDRLTEIHKAYLDAGSHVVTTNTFGANPFKCPDYEESIRAAVANARRAVDMKKAENPGEDYYVALDVGPLGKLLRPMGELDFEDAVAAFAAMVKAGAEGADFVAIETMNDLYELKAAVLAAKENCSLPVFATAVFNEQGTLMSGTNPAALVAALEGLGIDALGTNCSLGPKQLKAIVPLLTGAASVPVIVNPNAGMPKIENGKTVFEVGPDEFAADMAEIAAMGAHGLGGCCGTTPDHIAALCRVLAPLTPVPLTAKNKTVVASSTHTVTLGETPVLIGERINPTGKAKFKQALRDNDFDYIMNEGFRQAESGVHILDVNVGLPEIDEKAVLTEAVCRLQAAIDLPLQIDTADPAALESALRLYNGKPLINSVNGKAQSMAKVLPLVKKYGGVVVALTLDENGIPPTAHGRFLIAEKIVNEAAAYGIDKKDIIVDALTMAVSADENAAAITLDAIKEIKQKLGVATCLGVSNISFGLPARPAVTASFFAMALYAGLDAAIMNPFSLEMMTAYRSSLALLGHDPGFAAYIPFAQGLTPAASAAPASAPAAAPADTGLQGAIEKGLREKSALLAEELLKNTEPLALINSHIIPALDNVGKGFEQNKVFLPQLLMSADAAQAAFEVIKRHMPAGENGPVKATVVLATVKGDIHDIGKNILKVLLENYGYRVVDLGRDVPKEAVVEAVKQNGAGMVGLSALMTTTVPAMEETVKAVHAQCPGVYVAVGGAVLTQEYADMIGADFYSRDAMCNVRYAEELFAERRI